MTALSTAYSVFVGKVDSIDSNGGHINVHMSISLSWKGTSTPTATILNTPSTCAYHFEVDSTYLVYTSSIHDTAEITSLCHRTRHLWEAAEDLQAFAGLTSVSEPQIELKEFTVFPNYPNPANPTTIFRFFLPTSAEVTVRIFDLTGQLIETVFSRPFDAGTHEFNVNGATLPSGTYFCQIQTISMVKTQTFVILK